MVYSVLHFLTHPHLNPGTCASLLCEQPWPAASGGVEDVTHSKQNVALSRRLRVSSWVCDIPSSWLWIQLLPSMVKAQTTSNSQRRLPSASNERRAK